MKTLRIETKDGTETIQGVEDWGVERRNRARILQDWQRITPKTMHKSGRNKEIKRMKKRIHKKPATNSNYCF